jgi:soluble lytic murein transglycosylase
MIKQLFKRPSFTLFLWLFIFLLSFLSIANAKEGDYETAIDHIRKGRYADAQQLLNGLLASGERPDGQGRVFYLLGRINKHLKQYQAAEELFVKALSVYPILKDYILLDLSETYMAMNRYDKALASAAQVQSVGLAKRSEQITIESYIQLNQIAQAIQSLTAYAGRYPNEDEATFKLAKLLKDTGQTAQSVGYLKKLYINGGAFSEQALTELEALNAAELTLSETLQRAENLLNKADFDKAESAYRSALLKSGKNKREALMGLGKCQFRAKKYVESAKTFNSLSGSSALFWETRSYLRADNMTAFRRSLSEYGKRYGSSDGYATLRITLAQELIRKNDHNEAQSILESVSSAFPSRREEALWNLSWSYYKSNNFHKAAQYFAQLAQSAHGKDRSQYVYWHGRSVEKTGDNGVSIYKGLIDDADYYGFLARARLGLKETPYTLQSIQPVKPNQKIYDVIDELVLMDMKPEARALIERQIKNVSMLNDLLYLATAASKVDGYNMAIDAYNQSGGQAPLQLSYPIAYWDVIEQEAKINAIDPYLALGIIREESRMNPEALSWAGAIGLMQLMPATATKVVARHGLNLSIPSALYEPEKNIVIGIRYLASLVKDYRHPVYAVANYNAGPEAVQRWIQRSGQASLDEFIEDISYKETKAYVKKVMHSYWQYRKIKGDPLEIRAFDPFFTASR